MKRQVISGDTEYQITYHLEQHIAEVDGHPYPYEWEDFGGGEFHLRTGTGNFHVQLLERQPNGYLLFQVNGKLYRTRVKDEMQQLLSEMGFNAGPPSGETRLTAPMPGKVLQILVDEGGDVTAGDPIVILEAMKMENELRAPGNGRIHDIRCRTGSSVEKHQVLVTIRDARSHDNTRSEEGTQDKNLGRKPGEDPGRKPGTST